MGVWMPGTVTLEWSAGHYLHGLEIVMRRKSLGEVIDQWTALGAEMDETKWSALPLAERAAKLRTSAEDLAALIVEWNGADRRTGEPIAPDADGVCRLLTFDDIEDVWTAYRERTTRVSPPLPQSSDDGSASEAQVLELPTEPLSD